jgi:hypothetical protein
MNGLATPVRSSRQTKKAKGATKVGTRSNSVQGKRTPLKNRFSPLADLQETQSSDEEEVREESVEKEVDRPMKNKKMAMSKWDFLQRMTAAGHPIIHDQEQLELTYRYIDLANSMLSQPIKRAEELEDMQDTVDNEAERTQNKDTPPFFRGNMATTIMVNGVDQIVRHRRAKGWSQALTDLFWEARVMIRDFWVVKKHNEEVVSVLVQTSSRYQKIMAVGAVNMARGQVGEGLGRAQCRVNVRDAYPREQMGQVQSAYSRGFQLKKEGKIQAYRVYNQGGKEPVFEVRQEVNGRYSWGPAPARDGDGPASREGSQRRTEGTLGREETGQEAEARVQTDGGEREQMADDRDRN